MHTHLHTHSHEELAGASPSGRGEDVQAGERPQRKKCVLAERPRLERRGRVV